MMHVLSDIGLVCPMCIGGVSDMFLLVDFEGHGQRMTDTCSRSVRCRTRVHQGHDMILEVSKFLRLEGWRNLGI